MLQPSRISANLSRTLCLSTLAALASSLPFAPAARAQSSGTNTMLYTSPTTSTTFIVPNGVTQIEMELWGAGGGGGAEPQQGAPEAGLGGTGGGGGFAEGAITVFAGEVLTITAGAGGSSPATFHDSFAGGDGGGYSSVASPTSLLILAGGGGGGGDAEHNGGGAGAGGAASGGQSSTARPGAGLVHKLQAAPEVSERRIPAFPEPRTKARRTWPPTERRAAPAAVITAGARGQSGTQPPKSPEAAAVADRLSSLARRLASPRSEDRA